MSGLRAPRPTIRIAALLAACLLAPALGADGELDLDALARRAETVARQAQAWFLNTPPAERVTWGGLGASAALGLGVLLERSLRLRKGRIVPRAFAVKFLDRLRDGKLDRGKAADFCELNPSPAARVAQGAVRRWGRPAGDLERAVALSRQIETDRLRRHVGTLRRISALAPLLGLLGTLFAAERVMKTLAPGDAWGPAVASSLAPLTAGVALAILALVAYDGLMGRVEALAGELDRLGAETVDAIVVAAIESRLGDTRVHSPSSGRSQAPHHASARVEIPESLLRNEPRSMTDD